jgi:Rieske Fe-S protein
MLVASGTLLTGCAFLKGGASHPTVSAEDRVQGGTLRLAVRDLPFAEGDDVVRIKPGGDHPQLLVRKVAAGQFDIVTAKCSHLGCVVQWNAKGGEFLCPCHGSRFAADGKVLEGPAGEPLGHPASHLEGDVLVVDLLGLKG